MDLREQFNLQDTVKTAGAGTYLTLDERYRQQEAEQNASGITELLKANIADPNEASAVAGMTYTLADTFKQDPITILQDLPGWAARYNGTIKDNKGAWQQVWDGYKTGWATDRLGRIGSALMVDRTPEERQRLLDEAARVRASIPGTEGNSESFGMKMATSSAQLIGTMVRPLLTNLLVSAILPEAKIGAVMGDMAGKIPAIAAKSEQIAATATKAVGHGVSMGVTWADTAQVEAGNIYLDMLDAGVDEDIAKKYANIHGVIAGALEALPLEFAFTRFPFLKNISKNAFNRLCGRTVGKVGVAKTMSGALANAFVSMTASNLFETLTEVAQEGSAVYFEKKAALALPDEVKDEKLRKMLPEVYGQWRAYYEQEVADRKDYYESREYKDYVADRIWDVAVQTLLGTTPLSFFGASGQVIADVNYTRNIKKDAGEVKSRSFFINKHLGDEQLSNLSQTERRERLAQIYEENHDVEGISNAEAKNLDSDYMEINELNEQPDETEEEAVSSPSPKTPIKRRKDGRLHTQESMNVEHRADGKDIYTLKLGSAENRNRYGRIEYSIDNDTVRIEDVFMKPGQQELTGEFVTELMRRYPGYNVEWDAKTDTLQKVKDQLISENTVNPDNLQRFLGKGDINERLKVREYIQGKVKEAGGELTTPQAEVYTQLLEKMAEGRNMTLSEFANNLQFKTFEEAGDLMTEEEKAGNKGAFQLLNAAGKGIIYVGEHGDISTLFHELTHFAVQTDLDGATRLATALKNAAKTEQFRKYIDQHYRIMKNVTKKEGNIVKGLTTDEIIHAIETMDDNPMNWNATQHEVVAVLGETYFQEGRSFNKEIQGVLDKIIDFFYKIYRLMKQNALLNDEIIEAYDNLFSPELKEKFEAQEQTETQGKVNFQPLDLTQDFADIASGQITEQNIEDHINSLIGQVIDTATEPLQIQITKDNKAHVITTNVQLKGGQKKRHNAALNKIEKIINNAEETDTEPTDMTHNTSKKTLEHKQKVLEYVYFDSPIRIGTDTYTVELATERVEGQNPDILDLYNIHVKKTPAAAHLSTLQTGGFYDNNTTTNENVNPENNIRFQTDAEYLDAVNSGDMAKAQAMVDQRAREQGYDSPKLYHGSPIENIDTFDKNAVGTHTSAYGDKAFWFTDSQSFADDFSYEFKETNSMFFVEKGRKGKVYSAYLKMDKPFDLRNITPEMRELLFKGYPFSKNREEFDRWLDTDIKNRNHQSIKLAIDYNLLKENGYDSVIANLYTKYNEQNGERNATAIEYGVFEPNQIKSADPVTYDDNGNVIPLSQRFNDSHSSLLFQSAYHGSGASFDKFDTDYIGSGEGSQVFGWGIYLTQGKDIADDYAHRRSNWNEAEYNKRIIQGGEKNRNYANEIYNIMQREDLTFTEAKKKLLDIFDSNMEYIHKGRDYKEKALYRDLWKPRREAIENAKEDEITYAKNTYTVSIPDDNGKNYLYWDKIYNADDFKKVHQDILNAVDENREIPPDFKATKKQILENEWQQLIDENALTGAAIYGAAEQATLDPKKASMIMADNGFIGIDYPAGTIYGGWNGERNFVIFNADDITIDNHLLWQGLNQEQIESDMMADAKNQTLDEWLDFNRDMAIPGEVIDEEYLKAIWEKANNITETPEGEKVVDTSTLTEEEKDTAFASIMQTDDGVKGFLKAARDLFRYIDQAYQEGGGDENRAYLTRMENARSEFENRADEFMVGFVKGNKSIDEMDEAFLKSLQGKILKNKTEYRGLFAAITDNENMSVGEQELPFIDEPSREKMEHMTISEKRKFVDKLRDADAEKKILSGKETYEGAAENIIKRKNEEIAEQKKEIADKQKEIDREFDLLNSQQKKIVRQAEYQKEIQKKVNELSASIRAKLDKGVRIPTEEYQKLNSLEDRLKLIKEEVSQLNEQTKLKALVEKREALAKLKADIKEKEKERRAAQAIHDYKVKLVTYIQKKVGKNIWWEQAEAIKAIQAALDPTGYDNFFVTVNGERMNLTAFRSMVDRSVSVDKDGNVKMAELSPYQWRRYLNKDLSEYTIQDLEEMYDTVRYLKKVGREAWQQRVDQRNYEAQQWQNRIINEFMATGRYVSPSDVPLPETAEALKQEKNLWNMIRTGWYKTINMARKAQVMDGGTKAAIYKLLVSDKRDVQNAEYEAISKRIKPIEKLMKDLGVKPEDFYEKHTLKIKGLKENESTYTLAQLIYGIRSQFEERNKLAVMGGNLLNQEEKALYGHNNQTLEAIAESRYQQFIEQAKEILKGKEKVVKIADAIWNDWQNKNNFNRLNEAAIEEYNMPVDPVQFYMPIARKDFNGTELAQKIADDIFNQNAGKNRTSVEQGMLKSRQTISLDKQMPVDMDFFKLWTDSVKDQEHFIATNAYVRKLNRVFKAFGSKDLRANIESAFGRGMLTDIDNYINEVANPDVANDTQGVNKFLSILRGALYPAYLAFKSSSVILQMITSPAPFLREVGPLELAKGLIQMSIHPVATWEYVTGLSSFMENRSMNPLVDEVEAAAKRYNDPRWLQIKHKLQEVGTSGLEMADRWAVTAGWLAVFDKKKAEYLAEGMDEKAAEKKAVKYADDVVYETQPLGDKTELAPLFKVGGPAWQAFTQFQVSLNVIWNNLTYDVAVNDIRNKEYRKLAGTIIGYALAGVILYSVQEGWGTDDDDTPDEKLKKMLKAIAYGSTTQFTSAVPLLSNNADAIVKKMITGEKWQYRTNQLYPGFDELAMGIGTVNLKKILEGAAKLGGVPVSGPKEFYHVVHGKEVGDWRFYPQALLGRREK